MAKKSNKTEQVLKLITKNEESLKELMENEEQKEELKENLNEEPKEESKLEPKVEFEVSTNKEKELKYQAKLKIEIEPEIGLKEKEPFENQLNLTVGNKDPDSTSAFLKMRDHLVNIAEVLAYENIEMVMRRMNVCDCAICVNDVLAITLNSLPAKYVTTDSGKQYMRLDLYKKQYETDVLSALTKACVRVKASPNHS